MATTRRPRRTRLRGHQAGATRRRRVRRPTGRRFRSRRGFRSRARRSTYFSTYLYFQTRRTSRTRRGVGARRASPSRGPGRRTRRAAFRRGGRGEPSRVSSRTWIRGWVRGTLSSRHARTSTIVAAEKEKQKKVGKTEKRRTEEDAFSSRSVFQLIAPLNARRGPTRTSSPNASTSSRSGYISSNTTSVTAEASTPSEGEGSRRGIPNRSS